MSKNQIRERFIAHSRMLKNRVDFWHDELIEPGRERSTEILKQLNKAQIIIPILSSDFFSEYYGDIQYEKTLERKKIGVLVIPIYGGYCDLSVTEFAGIQTLPRGNRPLSKNKNIRDRELCEIVIEIKKIIEKNELKKPPTSSGKYKKRSIMESKAVNKTSGWIFDMLGFLFFPTGVFLYLYDMRNNGKDYYPQSYESMWYDWSQDPRLCVIYFALTLYIFLMSNRERSIEVIICYLGSIAVMAISFIPCVYEFMGVCIIQPVWIGSLFIISLWKHYLRD